QPLRAAVSGHKTKIDLRLTESGRIRRDSERARHRELTPAAERIAVDRGDDRLAEIFDEVEDVLSGECLVAPGCRRVGGELVDVGTGDERLVACARDDDRPDAIVAFELEYRAAEIVEG